MFLWIGLGILYVILLVTLGVATLRKGHWVMFTLGIFLPAVLGDRRADGPDGSRRHAGAGRIQSGPLIAKPAIPSSAPTSAALERPTDRRSLK